MLPPRPTLLLLSPTAVRFYARAREDAARLVVTHSTHLEGLLPTLRRVIDALPPPKLATVVPGRIAVCRGEEHDRPYSV